MKPQIPQSIATQLEKLRAPKENTQIVLYLEPATILYDPNLTTRLKNFAEYLHTQKIHFTVAVTDTTLGTFYNSSPYFLEHKHRLYNKAGERDLSQANRLTAAERYRAIFDFTRDFKKEMGRIFEIHSTQNHEVRIAAEKELFHALCLDHLKPQVWQDLCNKVKRNRSEYSRKKPTGEPHDIMFHIMENFINDLKPRTGNALYATIPSELLKGLRSKRFPDCLEFDQLDVGAKKEIASNPLLLQNFFVEPTILRFYHDQEFPAGGCGSHSEASRNTLTEKIEALKNQNVESIRYANLEAATKLQESPNKIPIVLSESFPGLRTIYPEGGVIAISDNELIYMLKTLHTRSGGNVIVPEALESTSNQHPAINPHGRSLPPSDIAYYLLECLSPGLAATRKHAATPTSSVSKE